MCRILVHQCFPWLRRKQNHQLSIQKRESPWVSEYYSFHLFSNPLLSLILQASRTFLSLWYQHCIPILQLLLHTKPWWLYWQLKTIGQLVTPGLLILVWLTQALVLASGQLRIHLLLQSVHNWILVSQLCVFMNKPGITSHVVKQCTLEDMWEKPSSLVTHRLAGRINLSTFLVCSCLVVWSTEQYYAIYYKSFWLIELLQRNRAISRFHDI